MLRGWAGEGTPFGSVAAWLGDDARVATIGDRADAREIERELPGGDALFAREAARPGAGVADLLRDRRLRWDLGEADLPMLLDRSSPAAAFGRCFGPRQPARAAFAPARAAAAPASDGREQLLCLVRGAARIRVCPPDAAESLALGNAPVFDACDLGARDYASAFAPLDGTGERAVEIGLDVGDLVYVPAFWWRAIAFATPATLLAFPFGLHPDKAQDDRPPDLFL